MSSISFSLSSIFSTSKSSSDLLSNLSSNIRVAADSASDAKTKLTEIKVPLATESIAENKLLSQKVLNSLAQLLGINVDEQTSPYQSDDSSAEYAAGEILASITKLKDRFLETNPSPEAIVNFNQQILKGVERGFNDAKEALQALGKLDENVLAEISKTIELVKQKLTSENSSNEAEMRVGSIEKLQAMFVSVEESQSTSIQVRTQEGDVITINISRASSASLGFASYDSANLQYSAIEKQSASQVSLSYVVEGDINEEEKIAIENLLKGIDKVSDKFFDGKVEQAFNKAVDLGFDTSQIAAFSFDLSNTSVVKAASVYQQVALETQPDAGVADAVGFVQGVNELVNQGAATGAFENAFVAIEDLLSGVIQLKGELEGLFEFLDDEEGGSLKELINEIMHALQAHEENEHDDDEENEEGHNQITNEYEEDDD